MNELMDNGMVRLDGGRFSMGSERFYPEERPIRHALVEAFWIDEAPVTNAEFARFVMRTGHRTVAEQVHEGWPFAGSAVFAVPTSTTNLTDPGHWWDFRQGACWHAPLGKGSSIEGMEQHPVVHIAFDDASAFAAWCGKRLPTEAEWEFAARGGLEGADYAWGNHLEPEGMVLANYWQGKFPFENTMRDGWERTSPVRSYPGNGWGLFDMIGNVWEWTSDDWSLPSRSQPHEPSCCAAKRGARVDMKVLKGGSHLCAANYCQRYRPAARHAQPVGETTGHIGFRCARTA
jgi:formylglycine-generating enzyme required for sulfatase activity